MAQFDTNVPLTTGGINVPQPHAVQNDSTATLIGQLGNVGLNTADQVQRSALEGQKAIGLGNVANYTVQLGKIQQAVAQGAMSSSAARSRIRDLRGQTIANNPSMLPQIDSATSSFLSDSGLGSDIVKGTDAEQQRAKIIDKMAGEGWNITPNMSPDQQDELVSAWQQQKLSEQQLQMASQQIAVTRGKLGITSDQLGIEKSKQSLVTGAITQQTDQLNLQQKMHQVAANQAVFSGASAWTTNFSTKMDQIVQQFNNSAKSPADQQAAIDQINLELAQITSNASKAGIGGDQSVIDQAISPMKQLATATTSYIQGKIQTQGLKDATDNAKNSAVLLAIHSADERSRKVLGIAMAAPGMSASFQTKLVDGAVLQMLGDNSGEPGTAPRGSADMTVGRSDPNYGSVDAYLGGIANTISKSNLGTLDPNSEHMLANSMSNIVNGLTGNTKAKTLSDYARITKFLADPAVNGYVSRHPEVLKTLGVGSIPGVNASDSQSASDFYAHAVVQPLQQTIQQEWANATVPQGKGFFDSNNTMSTPYGSVPTYQQKEVSSESVITPQFTGGGITFVAKDSKNSQAVSAADRLNAQVAPVVSRLIRATATLEGTSNYRKVWNETYAGWFGQSPAPEPQTQQPAQPTAPTNPTMDKPTTQLMNSVFNVESGGDNTAVSSKGAVGIGQMLPATADALGYSTEDLKDPAVAKQASTQYMGMMLDRFGGKVKLALAAYNYGPTRVAKLVRQYGNDYAAIEAHLPKETRDYVPKVMSGLNNG